jgi:hypothetical protein
MNQKEKEKEGRWQCFTRHILINTFMTYILVCDMNGADFLPGHTVLLTQNCLEPLWWKCRYVTETVIVFPDIIHRPVFIYNTQLFGDWILSPLQKPTQLSTTDRASP